MSSPEQPPIAIALAPSRLRFARRAGVPGVLARAAQCHPSWEGLASGSSFPLGITLAGECGLRVVPGVFLHV